jgi:D-proline reductase (dithiol) PrdB
MARMADLTTTMRQNMEKLECPSFAERPFVAGPPLARRRVAVISTAGLIRRGERPFMAGEADFRVIPSATDPADILMTHVSVNYDRTGFQRDVNVAFPVPRLKEMAAAGAIGSVAETHYAFMGAADPLAMEANARAVAAKLKQDHVDAVLLCPV